MSTKAMCWEKACKMLNKRAMPGICMVIACRWANCYDNLWHHMIDCLCGPEVQRLTFNIFLYQGSWVRIQLQWFFYFIYMPDVDVTLHFMDSDSITILSWFYFILLYKSCRAYIQHSILPSHIYCAKFFGCMPSKSHHYDKKISWYIWK